MAGRTITDVAKELGVPRTTLTEWVKADRVETSWDGKITARGLEQARELAEEREEDAESTNDIAELKRQLLEHKVRERNAISRLRELELQHESGRFVELALVQKDAADTCARILAVLRAIAQRSALAVDAALSAPPDRRAAVIERLITDEVERAIAEMAESKHGGTPG